MAPHKKNAARPAPTPVQATVHQDKRTNIPTADAREFVAPEVDAPTKLLYRRDPSLDPQLVWKGKDEQDAIDLEVTRARHRERSRADRRCATGAG